MPSELSPGEVAVRLINDKLTSATDDVLDAMTLEQLLDHVNRATSERLGRITLSLGCASWSPGDTVAGVIERADAALYRAKNLGRNRVRTENEQ